MKNKLVVRIALVTAFLLLIPLVAMRFSAEVDWSPFDFAVAGALLFGSGLAYGLIARKAGNTAYRAAIGIAVAAALLLTWVNLAVGIIGSENNPANLMYFAVLLVGIIGAGIARLRPTGMARALFVTACAQALVPLIALLIGESQLRIPARASRSAGCIGPECVLRHAVCRIGFAVSPLGAGTTRRALILFTSGILEIYKKKSQLNFQENRERLDNRGN